MSLLLYGCSFEFGGVVEQFVLANLQIDKGPLKFE